MSKCPSLYLTDRDRDVLGLEPWDCDLEDGHVGDHACSVGYVRTETGERWTDVVRSWSDQDALGSKALTYTQWRAMDCDQRHVAVKAMNSKARLRFLAQLGWDEAEFLAESAFLSRDHVYRDQVIARLVEIGTFPNAISGYKRAAKNQDAKRGRWAS